MSCLAAKAFWSAAAQRHHKCAATTNFRPVFTHFKNPVFRIRNWSWNLRHTLIQLRHFHCSFILQEPDSTRARLSTWTPIPLNSYPFPLSSPSINVQPLNSAHFLLPNIRALSHISIIQNYLLCSILITLCHIQLFIVVKYKNVIVWQYHLSQSYLWPDQTWILTTFLLALPSFAVL